MLKTSSKIQDSDIVKDIVTQDYRTACVFRKYGIDYCCGAKFPLEVVCASQNISLEKIKHELNEATRLQIRSFQLSFDHWSLPFLTDYIVHVHHEYLRAVLPETLEILNRFVDGHRKQFPFMSEVLYQVERLNNELIPHLRQEEEMIFPYIKQIAHAHSNREPYAGLLVRTLNKPVKEVMAHETQVIMNSLAKIRELTHDYALDEHACMSQKICYSLLAEIDDDLMQHLHLENNILFPKAIAIEKNVSEGR